MKVIIESSTGSQWKFHSLQQAKEAGAIKPAVTIKRDAVMVKGVAIFK